MLRYRINPERASGKQLTLGFRFTDTGEDFALTLRNSVLQIEAKPAADADVQVEMARTQFDQLFGGGLNEEQALAQGASITGNRAALGEFVSVIDRPEDLSVPYVSLR